MTSWFSSFLIFLTKWLIFRYDFVAYEPINNIGALLKRFWDLDFWLESPYLENSEIYTIATLTGHACLAVGDYTAIVPNGPYRKEKLHLALQEAGEIIGDQFDCSTLRRGDYEFHMGKDEQSDVLQVTFYWIGIN